MVHAPQQRRFEVAGTTASVHRGLAGRDVQPIGLGCWAIGGPAFVGRQPIGWGEVDDEESIRAIHRAVELGVTVFDTAAVYGCGHSERVLGEALTGRFGDVVVITKFGYAFDEPTRQVFGSVPEPTPESIRAECEQSLRRLGAEVIDVYLCHPSELPTERAADIAGALESLVAAGLIRFHGWSTDDPAGAAIFAESAHGTVAEHEMNLLHDAPEMVRLCAARNLDELVRTPLGMGVLTGKYDARSRFADDDVRRDYHWNPLLADGAPSHEALQQLDAVRTILTDHGRSVAQGALAWLWARSDRAIPIPGFRTVEQVEQNTAALSAGPLRPDQMAAIDDLLGRASGG
jgi:aryl-alcohol dehydrogenase-like predicted oxidoreductase